ncbi:hypothetical protein E0L36_25680 [Streptomyces sp. AJS327]|nr:hypothetical protein [Streptomyces sp. AJS327]
MMIGGGALATAAVAGVVAVAVINEGGGGDASDASSESLPSPEDLPSSSQPEPTFKDDAPPPPPPEDFIADSERDKAPLTSKTLFPTTEMTVKGRTYERVAVKASTKCGSAAHAGLGPVLSKNDCDAIYRATYTKDGQAVTVGIAVFEDTAAAKAVKKGYKPNLVALPGGDAKDFCRTVECRTTVNQLGRYAFFTIAGHADGKASGASDKAAVRAALDGSEFARQRVYDRGEKQAAEAAKES